MNVIGLDIGSMYAKAVLCRVDINKNITLVKCAAAQYKTKACKCGSLITLEPASEAIHQVLNSVREGMGDQIVDSYLVSVSGSSVTSYAGTAKIPLWKKEGDERRVKVTKAHVNDVVESAKMSYFQEKNRVLHTFPQEFQVDDQSPTKNPVSMTGVKMKANVYVIQAEKSNLENIDTVLKDCGIKNYSTIFAPLATAEALIDEEDKDNGVIVISVGAETTELTIYHNGLLRLAKVIPLGSDFITRDLKYIFKVDYKIAEEIKHNAANAYLADIDTDAKIVLDPNLPETDSNVQKLSYISEVVNARLKEIYEEVIKEIYKGSYHKKIHSSVILSGSGIKFKGSEKLFKECSQVNHIAGRLSGITLGAEREDSMYYTALGLVKYSVQNSIAKAKEEAEGSDEDEEESKWSRFKNFIKDIF